MITSTLRTAGQAPRSDGVRPAGRIPVLVCGERQRGDDGAGMAAVALLSDDVCAAARVVEVGQLDVLALLRLPENLPAVIVDAVAGIAPGEIWVRPLASLLDLRGWQARDTRAQGGQAQAAAATSRPRSSHELPIDQVLALVATLRSTPPAGTFVGLGGATWDVGAPLSPAVAAAVPAFAEAIAAAVRDAAASGNL